MLDAPRFEIRAPSMIPADGRSSVETRVFGIEPDGSVSHDQVVVTTSRPTAGAFVSPRFLLDDRGGATRFMPCNSVTDGCIGPARLSVALASDPQTELAHVDVSLVAPPAIADPAPCLTGGNVLYLDGHNFDYDAPMTFSTNATFALNPLSDYLSVHMTANNGAGPTWSLDLSTRPLGIPIIPSVYENAQVYPYDEPGRASFLLSGTGTVSACSGEVDFQVEDYDPAFARLTASFAMHCASDPTRYLNGCVHYQP